LGHVLNLIFAQALSGPGEDERVRRYFFVKCKTCGKHVAVPNAWSSPKAKIE
jgi:hypothetical protein